MEWIPNAFIVFKVSALAIGMYLAVKWHYDKAKKENGGASRRTLLWTTGKAVAAFVLVAGLLLLLTFGVGSMLGIDLTMP